MGMELWKLCEVVDLIYNQCTSILLPANISCKNNGTYGFVVLACELLKTLLQISPTTINYISFLYYEMIPPYQVI